MSARCHGHLVTLLVFVAVGRCHSASGFLQTGCARTSPLIVRPPSAPRDARTYRSCEKPCSLLVQVLERVRRVLCLHHRVLVLPQHAGKGTQLSHVPAPAVVVASARANEQGRQTNDFVVTFVLHARAAQKNAINSVFLKPTHCAARARSRGAVDSAQELTRPLSPA